MTPYELPKIYGLQEAITFATIQHHGQTRKDGVTPYILHPLRVMFEALEQMKGRKCQQYVAMVAILHDVYEDTPSDIGIIDTYLPEQVANALRHITQNKGMETYRNYIKRCCLDPYATLVKLEDIKDNCADTKGIEEGERKGLTSRWLDAFDVVNAAFREWEKEGAYA